MYADVNETIWGLVSFVVLIGFLAGIAVAIRSMLRGKSRLSDLEERVTSLEHRPPD